MEQRPEGRDVIEIRIYYEDTDCGGIVYYANYLKYFERARTQYLEDRRLSVMDLMNAGRVFVVVHAEIEYRAPARYGETRFLEENLASGGGDRLRLNARRAQGLLALNRDWCSQGGCGRCRLS